MIENELINHVDIYGLYNNQFGIRLSDVERAQIVASLKRIEDTLLSRIQEFEELILISVPNGSCYDRLRNRARHAQGVFFGVVEKLRDKNLDMEFYKSDLPGDVDGTYWPATDIHKQVYDPEVTLNSNPDNNWFSQDYESQDETLFHELSHDVGTDDTADGPMEEFNSATVLAGLLSPGKINKDWGFFKFELAIARQKCCDGDE